MKDTSQAFPGSRRARWIIWFAMAVLLLIPAVGFAAIHWQVLHVIKLYSGKRASVCTLGESLTGVRAAARQAESAARIRKLSTAFEEDSAGYRRWQTPKGLFWLPPRSETSLPRELAGEERHAETVHAGDVVLDYGAKVGVFARLALDAGAAVVVAIDRRQENGECLRRTFAREIIERRVAVYSAPRGGLTIDQLVEQLQLPRVDFIRIERDGRNALPGAVRTVERFHPRMAVSINRLPEEAGLLPALVLAMVPGYRMEVQCVCNQYDVMPEIARFY